MMSGNTVARNVLTAATGVAGAFALAGLARATLELWLGPLATGADFIFWAYVSAWSIAALAFGVWSGRSDPTRGFQFGLLVTYLAMLIAGSITIVVWLFLFYSSGSYDKGGYGRLATGLFVLAALGVGALAGAARVVAKRR